MTDGGAGGTGKQPLTFLDDVSVRRWAFRAHNLLETHRDRLDALNVFPVPDGDTGTNMYLTLHAALETIMRAFLEGGAGSLPEGISALDVLSHSTLLAARGNSGVILSQLVRGLAEGVAAAVPQEDHGKTLQIDGPMLVAGLATAARRAREGVSNPVEGTILTVADRAAAAAEQAVTEDPSLASVSGAALAASREALEDTPRLLPKLAQAGVVDAGGAGCVLLLAALHEIVTGVVQEEGVPAGSSTRFSGPQIGAHTETGDRLPMQRLDAHGGVITADTPTYEVMYLIDGCSDDDARRLEDHLSGLGDSVLVVGTVDTRAVHAHVDDPGGAVEAALLMGHVYGIRVMVLTNVNDSCRVGVDADAAAAVRAGEIQVALVACASGMGIAGVFDAAGAVVVPNGPGVRATPHAFLEAARGTGVATVIVLPNDKDVLLAARSAVGLARESGINILVIPTTAEVEGMTALSGWEPQSAPEDVFAAMTEAARAVRSGSVAVATRESTTDAGPCRAGQTVGYLGGTAVLVGDDPVDVAMGVITRLAGDDAEQLTLVAGSIRPTLAEEVAQRCTDEYPELEVVTLQGGQPVHALLLGAE